MFGGGQRVVSDLLDGIEALGEAPPRLILLGCRGNHFDRYQPRVVEYDGRFNRLGVLWSTARRLRRVLLADPPALLHTHGWDADVIGALALRGTDIRQVAHLHVTAEWLQSRSWHHGARRALTRWAFGPGTTSLVAVSDAVRQHWARHLPWNAAAIEVIHNGIDEKLFRPAPTTGEQARPADAGGPLVIGVAARLAPMKGLEHLLEAARVLTREGTPPFELRLAGEGNLRARLEEQAARLGIADRVRFLGLVTDMPAFYRGLDMFVLPSVSTEGLPLTVLEAMASGLPIVATTVGGTPEAVTDGETGLLAPPGDAGALAVAIRRLLDDEALRGRLGAAAREAVLARFTLGRFCEDVLAQHARCLGDGAAAAR